MSFKRPLKLVVLVVRLQGSAVTLEDKAPDEVNRRDGGGGGGGGGGEGEGEEPRSLSPSHAPLPSAHSDGTRPWMSESLLAESWSTMDDADAADAKSLDSSDGAAPEAGEENHSSNSDMVHLEPEEAEMLEEEAAAAAAERAARAERGVGGEEEEREEEEEEEEEEGYGEELQTSVMSVLGTERELVELRQEEEEEEEEQDLHAPHSEELLVTAEEPRVEREPVAFRQVVPPMALPPLPIVRLDPPSATTTPVSAPTTTASDPAAEPEELLLPLRGLHPPAILAPHAAPEPPAGCPAQPQSTQIPLSGKEGHSETEATEATEVTEATEASTPVTKALSSTELLCGGAALVAVVGIITYGAVAYCRK